MIYRRDLIGFGLLAPAAVQGLTLSSATEETVTCEIGDAVRIVALPSAESMSASEIKNPDLERTRVLRRRCLGRVFRVVHVTEEDLELDVSRAAKTLNSSSIGCSMSFGRDCLTLAYKRSLLPSWKSLYPELDPLDPAFDR